MTPLEKAIQKNKKVCCRNCRNAIIMYDSYYCSNSEKLILDMHLEVTREKQCKDRFKRKGSGPDESKSNT